MGGRFSVLRPISTSPIKINAYSYMFRGRDDGILIPLSTSTIVTTSIITMINSMVAIIRVNGLKRPISTSFITRIYSKIFIIINTIIITMVEGIMAGLSRPISKTSITTHLEIACLSVVVDCTLVYSPLIGFFPLS